MKKIQLIAYILFVFTSVGNSQFNKGSLLLGADLNFNTQTYTSGATENKSHGFSFLPTVAIATKQNTFWGISLNVGYSKNKQPSPFSEQTTHFYGGGIFCRKYKPVIDRLYAFIQAGVAAGFGKNESKNGPDSYSENEFFNTGLNITPGISVNVSKRIFLEAGFSNIASVHYSQSKTSSYNFGNTTNNKINGFSFSSSLGSFSSNLYFGFRFIIPKNY